MIIQTSKLQKQYGESLVVAGLDLSVKQGQCFGLLGPNGAGKTTTIRMLLGMTEPTDGSIQVLGHDVPTEAYLARQRIGVVPQLDNLDPDFTVEENLRVYASFFGITGGALEKRIDWLLDFAELQHKRSAKIGALSGGMQRRLTIARALVNDPELVVLDEPTTGLDPQVRHLIWSRLRELQREGKTLLLTTHYMEEAERLCDELAIMDNGKIVTQGSPKALTKEHIEPHVFEFAELVGEQSIQLSRLQGVRLEQSGTTWYAYTHEPEPIQHWVNEQGGVAMLQRQHNLEDVFLRLTRRDLRD
ncbi:MAG: ATP-binding cassette domain-containing protein [Gammaproteobacteria bacterium]|nr:ATP-binding cassette domain-containing protein [Gammaproteobacteria bacterium]